tara:strand:+ start:472 stop:1089 length:618 start_codon:yes stop_codon:yes gene_type:complete
MESTSKNILIIGSIILIYYFYNSNNTKNKSLELQDVKSKPKSGKKTNSDNLFHERLANLPIVTESNVNPLSGDTIGEYLKYFKQFNKPLVREIKQNIKRFNNLRKKIHNNTNNVYLIQEMDNLFFLKKTVQDEVISLIYSIDIENCEAEKNYNRFNVEINNLLEKSIIELKKTENSKNKEKNMESDISIFSGNLLADSSITPSNY